MQGKNSSGGDDEWAKLAEQVDEYTFKASGDCSDNIDFNDASDLEQDIEELDNNTPESNELVNAELDREREAIDESTVDVCEQECEDIATCEQELDKEDLALMPISVSEHHDVCV